MEHWLWPAFSPRWTSWRQNRLALPATLCSKYGTGPDHKGTTDSLLEDNMPKPSKIQPNNSQTKSSDSCSLQGLAKRSSVGSNANNMEVGSSSNPGGQCASIPLLYGLSEQIVPRPGFWPSRVHCCGFWQQAHTSSVRTSRPCSTVYLNLCRALSSAAS